MGPGLRREGAWGEGGDQETRSGSFPRRRERETTGIDAPTLGPRLRGDDTE